MKDRFYMFEADSTIINLTEVAMAWVSYCESTEEYVLKITMKNGEYARLCYNFPDEADADLWKLYELLGGN